MERKQQIESVNTPPINLKKRKKEKKKRKKKKEKQKETHLNLTANSPGQDKPVTDE